MKTKIRRFMAVVAGLVAGLCMISSAQAQSFLIVNTSGCIQWIQIKNSNGNGTVAKALPNNADALLDSAPGTGISRIEAGPTKSIDNCCYKRKINATVSLSGTNWRITIEPGSLKVINRDTYQEVFSAAGNFSQCVGATGAVGVMGAGAVPGGEPDTQRGEN